MPNNNISFSEAINKALIWSMLKDKNMLCYGLGINDPKKIFSTTKGLEEKFGKKRVFDVPCSENALTGISIGSAINGVRSVVTHQRLDFFLLAIDQIVNSGAKWFYMYGSQSSVPITIRLIIGRGWGQGPTHSQNLQALFNHIPGLKVVMPTFPNDARDLLISSIFDPNPVLFLEHRWLHETSEHEKKFSIKKIGKARKILKGSDITIVACSYLTIQAIKAAKFLKKNYNIDAEVIDLISIKPLDHSLIEKSVKKTKRLLVVDSGFFTGSIANDIIYNVIGSCFKILKSKPVKLAMPDVPEPTSFSLTRNFYIDNIKICKTVLKIFNINKKISIKKDKTPHDVPGNWFSGPF